ncbi:MAG: hypothetical protein AAFR37_01365, partial [Cyanobacteria bacterium J06628_3]
EILEILKSDESEGIREFIANSHNTPPEILNYLSNDSSSEVKQRVANNPNTPVETIEKLWRVDKIFSSSNHNTPSYIVGEKIAETGDSQKLCKILEGCLGSYPQIPASSLEKLASHQDDLVRSKVAEHPNTPVRILELLADDNYKFTRFYLAKNSNTPSHVLEKLFNIWKFDEEEYNNELSFLAGNPNSPSIVLNCLLNYRHFFIRGELLKNPNLPIPVVDKLLLKGEQIDSNLSNILVNHPTSNYEIVEKLLQSSNPQIRRNAIYTPHVTPEQWGKLARDESSEIRETIAGSSNSSTSIHMPSLSIIIKHPNLPLKIWEELAKDSSIEVREALTLNEETPEQIIELLASDESAEIRKSLISHNLNISFNILETLSRDISPNVRKAVAKHPNTSINLLEQLALDTDVEISQAIIDNPNTPVNLKETLQERLRVNLKGTLKALTRLYKPDDDLPTLLSEYIQSSVPFVRFISLMHPLIPTEFIRQYSQSLLWWERYAIAINSSTPLEITERFTQDSNFIVKAAAQDRFLN